MPVGSVVITGLAGSIGQRLVPLLAGERVKGIDVRAWPACPVDVELVTADLTTTDLVPLLRGADTLVHLAWMTTSARRQARWEKPNVDATRRVLAAATVAGVRSLVQLSSATVYGAWPDNPIPLTEEAALRPNPGVDDAIAHAEAERLVGEWAEEHTGAAVCILRPATVLGPTPDGWLARALGDHAAVRSGRSDPPRQFVHVDDVASAVALAVHARLDGVYNVAPDGSVTGEVVRGLAAGGLSVPVPGRSAGTVARWAWDLHLSQLPPAVWPLIEHPWVIANDRLRGVGWRPQFSSEEAVVAGRPGSWWREMGPARRQRLALAAAGGVLATAAVGAATVITRARRRLPPAG
jgi:nucleoside-diphosphate-sugar epimerase